MNEGLKNQLDEARPSLSINRRGISVGKVYRDKDKTIFFGANHLSANDVKVLSKDLEVLFARILVGAALIGVGLAYLTIYLASR